MRLFETRKVIVTGLALLAITGLPHRSDARKIEGFESGDQAVTSAGDAGPQGTFQGEAPPEGSNQYLITTIRNTDNEDTLTNYSGTNALTNNSLETFFNGITLIGVDGSGVLIPFTVMTGETALTFEFDFMSNEPFQSTPHNDFAFDAIFDNVGTLLGNVTNFATVNGSSFSSFGASGFLDHTGYQTVTISLSGLTVGQSYALAIGVADSRDANHASGVLIDNIQTVPEPSTVALIVAGSLFGVVFRKRFAR